MLMAKGPSELTRHFFVMFVAIPVWTTMSVVCHCLNSLVANGPFFVSRRAMSLVDDSSVGCSLSTELEKWITFLKVGSNFFQTCSSPFISASSADANLSFCWSSSVFVSLLMPSANESLSLFVWGGVAGGCLWNVCMVYIFTPVCACLVCGN